jgi:hypothetical protein
MLNKYFNYEGVYKIIYEDADSSKTIKGYIIDEDEIFFVVRAIVANDIVFIGKRSIIKMSEFIDG